MVIFSGCQQEWKRRGADPEGGQGLRYFDGTQLTDQRAALRLNAAANSRLRPDTHPWVR